MKHWKPPYSPDTYTGRLIGYARVSTPDQRLDLQIDALRDAGCAHIFQDHGVSGGVQHRLGLDAALSELMRGDTLVVYKLDRLGRSVLHLADLITRLEARGVQFCSLTEGIDTATPGGKLVFHVFGAVAEFSRSLIRENTRAGLAAARERGVRLGRPPSMSSQDVVVAHRLVSEGRSVAAVARRLGVSESTLRRRVFDGESLSSY